MSTEADPDDLFERLMKLLDVGLDALREGDGDGTILALKEAVKTAEQLPKKRTPGAV